MLSYNITDADLKNGKFKKPFKDEFKGSFICRNTNIISLEGSPTLVSGHFNCSKNDKLTSLIGSPKQVFASFYCISNRSLTSLEGAPLFVGMDFDCSSSKIISLEGIGRKYIKGMGEASEIYCDNCPIESNILGLILVKSLHKFSFEDFKGDHHPVENIINSHLQGNRDVLECQEELIEKGFKEYAKL